MGLYSLRLAYHTKLAYKAGVQLFLSKSLCAYLARGPVWGVFFFGWNHGFAMVELTEAASKQKVDLFSRDEKSEGELGPA